MSQQEQVFTIDEEIQKELQDALPGTIVQGHFGNITTKEQAEKLHQGWNLLDVNIVHAEKPLCAKVLR